MLRVSDPQRLTIQEITVRGFIHHLTSRGLDPHEFATEYAERTEALGYPPSIAQSVKQFMTDRGVGIAC